MIFVSVIEDAAGLTLVLLAARSAIGTVVVPRGIPSRLTRLVFVVVRALFNLRLITTSSDNPAHAERRDRVLVFFAPVGLLSLQIVWLTLVFVGFALAGAAQHAGFFESLEGSGSALLTLGFDHPATHVGVVLAFVEAGLGLALLALLITYLPSLYTAFSRREHLVRKLEVRAGDPPSGVELLERAFRSRRETGLSELWRTWENWFVDVEETHASFASLTYFRSPQLRLSWVTAAGAVLDAAALLLALDGLDPDAPGAGREDIDNSPGDPVAAEICLRSGTLALQRIAAFNSVPLSTEGVVRVQRREFADAWARLEVDEVPRRRGEDDGWKIFQAYRAPYDDALVGLAALVEAPPAPWSSDRVGERASPPGGGRLRMRVQHIAGDELSAVANLDPPVLLTREAP